MIQKGTVVRLKEGMVDQVFSGLSDDEREPWRGDLVVMWDGPDEDGDLRLAPLGQPNAARYIPARRVAGDLGLVLAVEAWSYKGRLYKTEEAAEKARQRDVAKTLRERGLDLKALRDNSALVKEYLG